MRIQPCCLQGKTQRWHGLVMQFIGGIMGTIIIGAIILCAIALAVDLFKYSASVSSGKFSGSLSIIGGLIIGDIAVELNWASVAVLPGFLHP